MDNPDRYTSPGRLKTVDAFRTYLQSIDSDFECVASCKGADGPLGRPLSVPGLAKTLGNRFAVHPMEGWDGTPDGAPSEHTLRRWRNFGRSGAKLVWGGEAFAVQEDGRANPNQLFLNPSADSEKGLEQLRSEILEGHRERGLATGDLVIGLQLTHSGRFSRPQGGPVPKRASGNPVLDDKFGIDPATPLLTDLELEAIGENFVRAAKHAQESGFDFVDVKCCHGYLLHELLGAVDRPGRYGGDFANRTRFFRETVEAIRSECPHIGIGVRLSMGDVYPHSANPETRIGEPHGGKCRSPYVWGFGVNPDNPTSLNLDEPFRFLKIVHELGIRLVNISLGSPYYNPHVQRPAAYPPSDGYLPPEDPLVGVWRQLSVVRRTKREFPDLILVGTGYSYLQDWLGHVAEYEVGNGHVDVVGIGRMVLAYPNLPLDLLEGRPLARKRICRTFSDCTTAPRNGMISGCYPLDPYYKALPEAQRLKAIKRAKET